MQGRSLRDGGCTEEDSPYREEDLVAERSHLGLVEPRAYMSPRPPPSLTAKAPDAALIPLPSCRVQTVKVPMMFGPTEHHEYKHHSGSDRRMVFCRQQSLSRSLVDNMDKQRRPSRAKFLSEWLLPHDLARRQRIIFCLRRVIFCATRVSSPSSVHQNLMLGRNRTDGG